MAEFRQLGVAVEFGDAQVAAEDVQPIHDMVTQELMLAAVGLHKNPKINFGESADVMGYALSFSPLCEGEDGGIRRYLSVRVSHFVEPSAWQVGLRLKAFNNDDRHGAKWSQYRFEVAGEDVVEAKKQVYLVRARANIGWDISGEPLEVVHTSRLMFERSLTSDDCQQVAGMLARGVARARVA